MPRRERGKEQKKSRLDQTREKIHHALRRIDRSALELILDNVFVIECEGKDHDPQIAATDAEAGVIFVNPHRRHELGEAEWTFVLAHQMLHIALRHGRREAHYDPLIWNLACDHAADNLLAAFKIGTPLHELSVETAFAGQPESRIYDMLLDRRRSQAPALTYAGPGRPDLITRSVESNASYFRRFHSYQGAQRRTDWENLFAEGIRQAVERVVQEAAEDLGEPRGDTWGPAERARRWVVNEFPLLGALAPQIRVIADRKLCERMDISVAAINPFLGEIYFNPDWNLTQDEWTFIYVHEVLHAALLHHTRLRGRDPYVWNIACDFVINAWLIEMNVGALPSIGALYDPSLQGKSADEVYDLLINQPKRCKSLRGFRGRPGDLILDGARRIYRGDVTTLDDVYRRCLQAGLSCMGPGRGFVPAGLLEEIQSLFSPPPPWDVELGRWIEAHVPLVRDSLRSYARASRRQGSTPDIPRPARYVPQEWLEACTFGVVMDSSGSMDRELLGRALGTIASYCESRDVPRVRLILCDAAPYDQGFVAPMDLRERFPVKGRGGTVLQPGVNYLLSQPDFPQSAPVMIITDGWCEEEILCPREHCFVLPRKGWKEGAISLRTSAPVFRVIKRAREEDDD